MKSGRQAAAQSYKELKTMLESHYSKKAGDPDGIFFHKSGNQLFPDCLVVREIWSDVVFVIIEYWGL